MVNQIWLGKYDPPAIMQETQKRAESNGFKYKLWNWKSLGDTFGFYLFWNFKIDHVAEFVYSFLVKYYIWQILEKVEGYGVFLDANRPLIPEMITSINEAKEDIVLGPMFNPYFVVCKNTQAAVIASTQIRKELDHRYQISHAKMFDFLYRNKPNILGRKYMYCTMVPIWQTKGIRVTNLGILAGKEQDLPLTDFIPAIYPKFNNSLITLDRSSAVTTVDAATPKKRSGAISCSLPSSARRVIVMGNECIGITDISTYAVPDDVIVHINACTYLKYTGTNAKLTNIVYYDKASLLPANIRNNSEALRAARQIYPGSAFESFEWRKKTTSQISSSVALAVSYKEKYDELPVILYGYNVADDVSNGNDSELEEVLLKEHGITVYAPTYEVLFLVLSSSKRKLRWLNAEATWCKKTENTHHTWRFAYASPKKVASNIEHAWAIPCAEDVDVSLKSFIETLKNAARMRFKYVYICKDLAEPDPSVIWSILRTGLHKCVGAREYDSNMDLLYFNLGIGACLNRDVFENCLVHLNDADDCTVDIALAKALKKANVALEQMPS